MNFRIFGSAFAFESIVELSSCEIRNRVESSWEFSIWLTSRVKLELKLLYRVDSSRVELPSRVVPPLTLYRRKLYVCHSTGLVQSYYITIVQDLFQVWSKKSQMALQWRNWKQDNQCMMMWVEFSSIQALIWISKRTSKIALSLHWNWKFPFFQFSSETH